MNYIRGRTLNHRQFRQLMGDMDNQFTDVPYYTEVRSLWCQKVLKKFYLLRQEITMFLEMKDESTGWQGPKHRMTQGPKAQGDSRAQSTGWLKGQSTGWLVDKSWLEDLAFFKAITEYLNYLNLKLQEKNNIISELYDDIKCFGTKA